MSRSRPNILRVSAALLIALALTVPSWGHDFPLTGSSRVPAASGTVTTSTDRNGNTKVEIKVKNLAIPSKLEPPATLYMVWFQQSGSEPQSQGVLMVNSHLDGLFRTTTQWTTFRVFITPETDRLAKTPSGEPLLSATVQT